MNEFSNEELLSGDVLKHNRERELIRASEVRYRRLFEAARDGILILDMESATVTDSNPYMTEILGYSREEFVGKDLAGIGFFRDRDAAMSAMEELKDSGYIRYDDLPLRSKDGQVRDVEFVSNVYQEDGRAVIQCNIRDITDRKRVAEAASRHQSEVVLLNERLQRAMTEAHHRVKNNLQIIAAMIDLRLMDNGEMVSAKELRRVQSSIRALAAVHDLLTERAKESGDANSVSAKSAIEKLLALIEGTNSGVRIHAEIDEGLLTARQAASVAIVLNELLSNAMKYGRGGVDVRYTVGEAGGQLTVCDNGPGFPPGFDPSSASHTGLEMVTMISRWDLGGQATYRNRPEGGACVGVTIR